MITGVHNILLIALVLIAAAVLLHLIVLLYRAHGEGEFQTMGSALRLFGKEISNDVTMLVLSLIGIIVELYPPKNLKSIDKKVQVMTENTTDMKKELSSLNDSVMKIMEALEEKQRADADR